MEDLNEEEVRKEAKEIMKNFIDALGEIDLETDFELLREDCLRSESVEPQEQDTDFKELFLNNAPRKSEGYILAEKGKWVTK